MAGAAGLEPLSGKLVDETSGRPRGCFTNKMRIVCISGLLGLAFGITLTAIWGLSAGDPEDQLSLFQYHIVTRTPPLSHSRLHAPTVAMARDHPKLATNGTSILTSSLSQSAWSRRPAHQRFPCQLLYVKLHKCASSTNGGIARRIAARHGVADSTKRYSESDKLDSTRCHVRANHIPAGRGEFAKRVNSSFLWSFVREPNSRALSEFNWRIRNWVHFPDNAPTGWRTWPAPKLMRNLAAFQGQVEYLRLDLTSWALGNLPRFQPDSMGRIPELLRDYDFIGVVEREDESLVVLRLLLGLDAGDVLYVSSKVAWTGKVTYKQTGTPEVVSIPNVTKLHAWKQMEGYMQSEHWKERRAPDRVLWEVANQKLDATIASLGQEFDEALATHKHLLTRVKEECGDAVFPPLFANQNELEESNSTNSTHADCYFKDNGCAVTCLDQVAATATEY